MEGKENAEFSCVTWERVGEVEDVGTVDKKTKDNIKVSKHLKACHMK